jgi:hypothetical protein
MEIWPGWPSLAQLLRLIQLMTASRFKLPADRVVLVKECLDEIRLWPGCEGVREIAILSNGAYDFLVRVVSYGSALKRTADRAALCIEREKRRRYHLR